MAKRLSPVLILLFILACAPASQRHPTAYDAPMKIIWAWERPEDLRFLDPNEFGVAFLAQTVTLARDEVRSAPRRQPLFVPDGTYVIAVTRVETIKAPADRPLLTDHQIDELVSLTLRTLERPHVRSIQIDFDAVVSERGFYRRFMESLRARMPAEMPLTMTALASWCVGDRWLNEIPVHEAVPMVFEMGRDGERIRSFLAEGSDWNEPLCTASYGLSVDERPVEGLRTGRRFYYFKDLPWVPDDLDNVK